MTRTPDRHWELLPHFVLRSTGFPVQTLDTLVLVDTAAALDAFLDAEERLPAAATAMAKALAAGGTAAKVRKRCYRAVSQHAPIGLTAMEQANIPAEVATAAAGWDAAVEEVTARERAARAAFEDELPARRQALRDAVTDPRVQEAIWLSSPPMLERGVLRYLRDFDARHRPSATRRIERQLASYLQRFCAKNDTTSFFGPVAYGDFADPAGTPAAADGAGTVLRREAFLAYWAVTAVAAAVSADPAVRPHLRPRITPLVEVDPEAATVRVGAHTRSLPPPLLRVLTAADGTRSVTEIAAALGSDVDGVLRDVETLTRSRILTLALDIPVTALRPLPWLVGAVQALPPGCPTREQWLATLATLATLQERFAAADLPDRRALLAELEERLAELPAPAGGGRPEQRTGFYADRLAIYEECLGATTPTSLGPTFRDTLTAALAPALDAIAAHAIAEWEQLRRTGAGTLRAAYGDRPVPFLDAVATLTGVSAPGVRTGWQEAAQAQLREHAERREVELDLSRLPQPDPATAAALPLLTSPDVLLLARDEAALRAGDFRVVLGECHDTLMVWGWALALHDRREQVEAAGHGLLRRLGGRAPLASVLPRNRVKIVPYEYDGPTIELAAPSARPAPERVPASATTVQVEEDGIRLHAPGWPELLLANGELDTFAHRVLAPPRVVPPRIDLGAHTPRLTCGRLVLQRERWRLSRADLLPGRYSGSSFELLADYRRAARRLSLPRYVFVTLPAEPKPLLVDRDNYFLLELLEHAARPGDGIDLTEMLPGPRELWLGRPERSYCAELRLSAFHVQAGRDA